MADTVIDSYEAAQKHRDEANKPNYGHGKETAQAEPATETAEAPRAAKKTAARKQG